MKFSSVIILLASTPALSFTVHPKMTTTSRARKTQVLATRQSWDSGDDWGILSSSSPDNAIDGAAIFNVDPVMQAARDMSYEVDSGQPNEEDNFISDAVDTIYSRITDANPPTLYDTIEEFDQFTTRVHFDDDVGRQISLLVRCNENPDELLVSLGRMLPDLKEEDKYDAKQILKDVGSDSSGSRTELEATDFFTSAVNAMFHIHASPSAKGGDDSMVLAPVGIASWMSKSLGDEVGQHDKRVTIVIAKYSAHGSGVLSQSQFMQLYMDAAVLSSSADQSNQRRRVQRTATKRLELPTIRSVWRDLENHGFRPPIVEERESLQKKLDEEYGIRKDNSRSIQMMDECEILEWKNDEHSTPRASSTSRMKGATSTMKKSSHELVELASDGKTPGRLRDGDFVFIDEESCIGCTQCANVAPSAFTMLDNGRARTFQQSNEVDVDVAVSICPVACMHKVAFHELEEMETARDVEGRNSGAHIPLNVARIDSDANRKSSWYHTLKHKCYTSKSCPQRGCFDCPMYDTPGANPYSQQLHKTSEHVRATDIMNSGEADPLRKVVDL
jgi:ferredoxin